MHDEPGPRHHLAGVKIAQQPLEVAVVKRVREGADLVTPVGTPRTDLVTQSHTGNQSLEPADPDDISKLITRLLDNRLKGLGNLVEGEPKLGDGSRVLGQHRFQALGWTKETHRGVPPRS